MSQFKRLMTCFACSMIYILHSISTIFWKWGHILEINKVYKRKTLKEQRTGEFQTNGARVLCQQGIHRGPEGKQRECGKDWMRKECKWEMWSEIKRDLQVRQSDPKRYSDSQSITCTHRHNIIWTCAEGKKAWEWFCEARKCTECL